MKFFQTIILLFAFSFTAQFASAQDEQQETYEYLQLFGETLENIKRHYVDEASDKELIEAAIRGMMQSLDPHSVYLDESSFSSLQESTRGEFGGLGIEVNLSDDGYILVVSPIDDTPADRAGLQSGDLITEIGGKPVLGMTLSEAVELMRGKPDSKLDLQVLRGKKSFEVTITRAIIKIEAVKWELKADDVGYIRISTFSENVATSLRKALKSLRKQKARGYILDLRNNPGGLLNQAVKVSDVFLERGEIVSTSGRDPSADQRFQAEAGDDIKGAPLLVLINGGSASASEIVAGALQDHKRALIVGSKSFGKGSVQAILPLSKESHGLKLTIQRYYTPSGASIQAKGIVPDIEIVPSTVTPIQQEGNFSEADLPKALENESTEDSVEAAAISDDDYVLTRAIEIVKAIGLHEANGE